MYQYSSETLEEIVDGAKRTLYFGVDPTADSMHVGNLCGALVLRRFVEHGHKLVVLVGGGTGTIGDPGGKSSERNLLDDAVVASNAEALRVQFARLLGGVDFEMVNNANWLRTLNLLTFLRDVGKHFTVNEMIKRDSVRPRIETPNQSISFTEFSYMLLQAYDYLHLHTEKGCDLQVGGSDQWGNIISGVDLVRRKTLHTVHAFSWPLLVDKKTGKKFGKSEQGPVWLDPKKTSVFQFYQFWLNVDDDVVEDMLFKMTFLSGMEIGAAMVLHARDKKERHAQRLLAREVTTIVHGADDSERVENISEVLFSNAGLTTLDARGFELLRSSAPSYDVDDGISVLDALVQAKLAESKREARQFVVGNAVMINDRVVNDAEAVISRNDFYRGYAILKRGKRNVGVLMLR